MSLAFFLVLQLMIGIAMATYAFDPTVVERSTLALVRFRESSDNYQARNPTSSSTGAYGFIPTTWRDVCRHTGVDAKQYPRAHLAPPSDQDVNALWLLRRYGANSSHSWKASGPYPTAR